MDKLHYVYGLYGPDLLIRYIGVSVQPSVRLKAHIYESKNSKQHREYNLAKCRWIRKINSDIDMRILFNGTEDECYEKEMDLISKYKTSHRLVNSSPGGDKPPGFYSHSIEMQELIRTKIRKSATGRITSAETKDKQSKIHKSLPKPWLDGYKKQGIENPRAFSIQQLDMEGNLLRIWSYGKEASDALGISRALISGCINGKYPHGGGFLWKKHTQKGNKSSEST